MQNGKLKRIKSEEKCGLTPKGRVQRDKVGRRIKNWKQIGELKRMKSEEKEKLRAKW